MSARPSKGQCRNSKIFPPLILTVKVHQNIFFPETCFASTISEPEFKVCILVQWLSEQMECGNLQIGKTAVALWIQLPQKLLIPNLKALIVTFNLRSSTSKTVRLIDF